MSCYRLSKVTIGSGVTSIGFQAFDYCYQLMEICNASSCKNLNSGTNSTPAYNHYDPNEGNTKIKVIDDFMFYVDDNVCHLFAYVGSNKNITLPQNCDGREYTFTFAFYGDSVIESVTIPETIYSIPSNAFNMCTNLKSVTLPNSITSIGGYAFADCASLEEITLPQGITNLKSTVFYCTPIREIVFLGTSQQWSESNNASSFQKYGVTAYAQTVNIKCSDGYIEH